MRRASDAGFVREKGARLRLATQRRANIGSPCGDLGYTPLMYPTGFPSPWRKTRVDSPLRSVYLTCPPPPFSRD